MNGLQIRRTEGIDEEGISTRTINTIYRNGADRGKRLFIGKEVTDFTVSYNDRGLLTALYGRGKGAEVDATDAGNRHMGIGLQWQVLSGYSLQTLLISR